MKKILYIFLSTFLTIVSCFFLPVVFSAQESITISTYYPAPYGVYKNIRFYPSATAPVCDSDSEGVTYYNSTVHLLRGCRMNPATNVYEWQDFGSHWTLTDGNLTASNSAWNIGVGTGTPVAKLTVAGEVAVGNSGLVCSSVTAGAVRYNSNSKKMQYCDGTNWDVIGGPKMFSVKAGGDTSTSSLRWVDMDDMSITKKFDAGYIYIFFNAQIRDDGATWNWERVLVDNDVAYQTYKQDFTGSHCSNHDGAGFSPVNIATIKYVDAGTHTIKVQWKVARDNSGGDSAYQDGSCSPRQLMVIQPN